MLHSRAGWELSLENINHGISAFSLHYELDYQIRYLGYTGYNDVFMKVDITDVLKSRCKRLPLSHEVREQAARTGISTLPLYSMDLLVREMHIFIPDQNNTI